jgi:hypothetical protein
MLPLAIQEICSVYCDGVGAVMHQYAPFSYERRFCILYFKEDPFRFVFDLELGTGLHVVAVIRRRLPTACSQDLFESAHC